MCSKNFICLECTCRNERSRESCGLSLTLVVTRAWTQTWWHMQLMEKQVEVMQGQESQQPWWWQRLPVSLCAGLQASVLPASLLWSSRQTHKVGAIQFSSVQFSSVAQSCPTLCYPMDCSMPGLPVPNQLPEFTQTCVHWVGDAIQPSCSLLFPSLASFNLSQHQGLF